LPAECAWGAGAEGARLRRGYSHDAEEWANGNDCGGRGKRVSSPSSFPVKQEWVLKTVFEKAKTGMMLDHPQPLCWVARTSTCKHVAGFRAVDPDRACERMKWRERSMPWNAWAVMPGWTCPPLASTHSEADFITGCDAQARFKCAIPEGVGLARAEAVFAHGSSGDFAALSSGFLRLRFLGSALTRRRADVFACIRRKRQLADRSAG